MRPPRQRLAFLSIELFQVLFEPTQTPYDLNFRLLGIPVRVHPLFWAVAAMFGMSVPEPGALVTWVFVVFVSVLVHEMGHALVARHFGCQPYITLYGLGGLASYRPTFNQTYKHILILLAGPGAGFLLAALVTITVAASGHVALLPLPFVRVIVGSGSVIENPRLNDLVWFLLTVNILWGIINLLPVYPLDGGQIARFVFRALNPWDGIRQSLWLSVLAGALLAFLGLSSGSVFIAIFFGYLAFNSYQAVRGPTGGFGR
jgi:Zn-dependent protease